MRRAEAGFTLLELVVTVAIAVILIAAGGVWMLSMRPGALRGALNDFDANLAAAKAIAGTSGNGATLIFEPQSNGSPGYTLSVYSGRPTASGAVTATNTMIANSAATISETHFGNPPFAIFLSSAGYPTGSANYPSLSDGTPNFTTITTEPPCPSGGIELTFTSPQGVTATRTLPCNVTIASAGGTDPTPSPNPMKVEPPYLLAHYTTDSGPLKFEAVEYGYYHWYESLVGQSCQGGSSDTGAPPAVFPSPWPYAQPSPSSQGAAAPAPPSAPYTWPVGDPNDPAAWFQLSPVSGNGGICTVTVADDYGQSGSVTVQVMGNLRASPAPPTPLQLTVGQPGATVNFGKTFDGQQLVLAVGGPCLGIVSASSASGFIPASPSHTSAGASVAIAPLSQGACTLIVQDQYGEQVQVPINVAPSPTPRQNFGTWPASLVLGASGGAVGYTESGQLAFEAPQSILARVAPIINELLGGTVARAQSTIYTGVCYAQAFQSGTGGAVDVSISPPVGAALGISVTTDGCILDGGADAPYGGAASPAGPIAAYEPAGSGQMGNFSDEPLQCNGNAVFNPWSPDLGRNDVQASVTASGTNAGVCSVDVSDGTSTQSPAHDAGQVAVSVVSVSTMSVTCSGFIDQEGDRGCNVACQGTEGGCAAEGGDEIEFPCPPAGYGGGPFELSTGEGTSGGGYSISPGQSEEITVSSDGTAFLSATSC
jgi:prepilin-type N-terminal cleavage/methylation domain-containing protein